MCYQKVIIAFNLKTIQKSNKSGTWFYKHKQSPMSPHYQKTSTHHTENVFTNCEKKTCQHVRNIILKSSWICHHEMQLSWKKRRALIFQKVDWFSPYRCTHYAMTTAAPNIKTADFWTYERIMCPASCSVQIYVLQCKHRMTGDGDLDLIGAQKVPCY